MAAPMKATSILLIAAVMMVAVAPRSAEAMECSQVVSYLGSCISYVTDQGPIGNCCSGVKGLYSAASTTADRQAVCGCLKNLAAGTSGVNYDKATGLPSQCGVSLPYKISPSTDCSKVQ